MTQRPIASSQESVEAESKDYEPANTQLLATSHLFTAYDSKGVRTYQGNVFQYAINNAKTGGRIDFIKGYSITTKLTFKIGYSLTINFNGSTYVNNTSQNFIELTSGTLTLNGGGGFTNNGSGPAIKITGGKDWRPVVNLNNAKLKTNGQHALYIDGGRAIINNSTVEGNNYSVWIVMPNGANNLPELTVKGNSVVYGIYSGATNSKFGGNIYIQGGAIRKGRDATRAIQSGNTTNYYITGGSFYGTASDITYFNGLNKNSSQYRLVSSGSNYSTMKRYSQPKFDLMGGKFVGYTPPAYHYYGDVYNFANANQIEYRKGSGIKFAGWYKDKAYTQGSYTHRLATATTNDTYYARYTYTVEFDKNGSTENPVKGNNFTRTFNAGNGVYNSMPTHTLTRPGYKFMGWSRSKTGAATWKPGTAMNYDANVVNGKVTLYAVWEPELLKSNYAVQYFFERLDGTYFHDTTRNTRFNSTAGNISDPSFASFTGHTISNKQEHINLRKVVVRGDNTSVVKLYYNLNRYTVKFKDALGNDYGDLQTIKYGGSAIAPETPPIKFGYDFLRWDQSFNSITKDLEIKPIYSPKKMNFRFNHQTGDDAFTNISQIFDNQIIFPKSIAYSGKIFLGWFDENGKQYNENDIVNVESDLSLTAKWKSGKPGNKIILKQLTDTRLIFSNYANYEYRLEEIGSSVGEYYDWTLGNAKSFSNLKPNTEYKLFVRIPGATNFDPSDQIEVGTFRTLINFDIKFEHATDTQIFIKVPTLNMRYGLKNPEGKAFGYTNYVKNEDNTYTLEYSGLNPNTVYSLEYQTEKGFEASLNYDSHKVVFNKELKTLESAVAFVGDNNITIISNENGVVVIGENLNETYEYRLGSGQWMKPTDGRVTFNHANKEIEGNIYVRNMQTETHAASLPAITQTDSTKNSAVELTEEERTHLRESHDDDNYRVTAKPGYIYSVGDKITNVDTNGFIIYAKNTQLLIQRDQTTLYEQSNIAPIISFERPNLTDDERNIDLRLVEDELIMQVTNPKTNISYQLREEEGSTVIQGVMENGIIWFNDLKPGTTYNLWVQKTLENNPYKSEYRYIKSETTGVQPIIIEEGSEFTPAFNYSIGYSNEEKHQVIVHTQIGYDYMYENQIYKGDGKNWIINHLEPVTNYTFKVRINDSQYVSNYMDVIARTTKIPKAFINPIDQTVELKITDDQIIILNALSGYEYAIVEDGKNVDETHLEYISGNDELTFYNLKHATMYKIYSRKIEDDKSEASHLYAVEMKEDGVTLQTAKTKKLTTPKVLLPTSDEVKNILEGLRVTNQKILLSAYENFEYLIIKNGGTVGEHSVWVTSIELTELNIDDIYDLYIRRAQTDTEEVSKESFIREIIINKDEQEFDGKEVIIVSVLHDKVFFKQEIGYDYSIDQENWVTAEYTGNQSFDNLNPVTTYQIYIRLTETENKLPSNDFSGASFTTTKIPTSSVSIDLDTFKIELKEKTDTRLLFSIETPKNGLVYEYSIDQTNWISTVNNETLFNQLNPYTMYNIYVRSLENDTQEISKPFNLASEQTLAPIPTRENSLLDLDITETSIGFTLAYGYDYRVEADGEDTWFNRLGMMYYQKDELTEGQAITIIVRREGTDEAYSFEIMVRRKGLIPEDFNVQLVGEPTDISITIDVDSEYAYAIKEKNSEQELNYITFTESGSHTFTELQAFTDYEIYVKKLATDETTESLEKMALEVKTDKVPAEKRKPLSIVEQHIVLTDDNRNKDPFIFTGYEGLEYAMVDEGSEPQESDWKRSSNHIYEFSNVRNKIFFVRRHETENKYAGIFIEAPLRARAIAPDEDLAKVRVDNFDTGKNILVYGLENAEYSLDNETWLAGENILFETIPNTDYIIYVRRTGENLVPSESRQAVIYKKIRDDHYEVEDGKENNITTPKEFIVINKENVMIIGISSTGFTILGEEIYEYSIDENTWLNGLEITFTDVDFTKNPKVFIRIAENHQLQRSNAEEVKEVLLYDPQYVVNKVENITHNKITLQTDDTYTYEFFLDGIKGTNGSLRPNKSYQIHAVYNNDYQLYISKNRFIVFISNDEINDIYVTTTKIPKELVILTDEDKTVSKYGETILPKDGFEMLLVTKNETVTDDMAGQYEIYEYDNTTHDLYIRKLETDEAFASKYEKAIVKLYQESPEGKFYTIGRVDYNKVELENTQEIYEYSVDGIKFYSGTPNTLVIDGLNPNTEYPIYVRAKETLTHAPSNAILVSKFITNNETITEKELREYLDTLGFNDLSVFESLILEAIDINYPKSDYNSINETINAYKDLIKDKAFEARKQEVSKELTDYANLFGDNLEAAQNIINEQVNKVDSNNYLDLEEIKQIINEGKKEIDALLLEESILKAISKFETIKNDLSPTDASMDQIFEKGYQILKDAKSLEELKIAEEAFENEIQTKNNEYAEDKKDQIKEEIKKELEEKNIIITPEIETIINEKLDEINGDNYKNNELMEEIKESIKENIEEHQLNEYKQEVIKKAQELQKEDASESFNEAIQESIKAIQDALSKDQADALFNELKETLESIENNEQAEDKKDQIKEEIKKELEEKNIIITPEIETIINEKLDEINGDNYTDDALLEKIIETIKLNTHIYDGKEEFKKYIGLLKEQNGELFTKVVGESLDYIDNSKNIDEIKIRVETAKNQATLAYISDFIQESTQLEIENIKVKEIKETLANHLIGLDNANKVLALDTTIKELSYLNEQLEVIESFHKHYNLLLTNNRYKANRKNDLKEIYETYLELLNQSKGISTLNTVFSEGKIELEKINPYAISEHGIIPGESLPELDDTTDMIKGGITNDEGLKSTYKMVVKNQTDQALIEAFKKALQEGKINLPEGINLEQIIKQSIGKSLDIYLDNQGQKVTEFIGSYKVSLLIPTEIREYLNLRVVHYTNGIFEVIEPQRESNYLTFETTSFSPYFIIGDKPQEERVNLWWAIGIEIVIILVQALIITRMVQKRKNNKKIMSISPVVLLTTLPINAIPVIIILGVIILILMFVIIYIALIFKRKEDIVTEEKNIHIINQTIDIEEIKEEPKTTIIDIKKKFILYKKSYEARLIQSPEETQLRYSDIKNHLLSYKMISSRMTWNQESFVSGKNLLVKIVMSETTFTVFYALTPEQVEDPKYKYIYETQTKKHLTTPLRIRVKGPRGVKYAKELIDILMKTKDYEQSNIPKKDYRRKYQTNEELVNKGLVRKVDSDKALEEIVES
ncbi:hypothetical protein BN85400360 [Alteracholeplasma palmae J233]|uniref:Uncharacterized protein n=1 Tax=Alteracholeplasma palmae (strain ATCC 49389 / J233) TaxID=1318466 RepID=U4KJN7_ALTPJ|nr:InlB B-repeat-containing protein [Alteracholeplasma palmae]CCV63613.1 hypothetical protein BN85400360 [Alteracholeplasma palmae J233]